jgi:hypothetical protein
MNLYIHVLKKQYHLILSQFCRCRVVNPPTGVGLCAVNGTACQITCQVTNRPGLSGQGSRTPGFILLLHLLRHDRVVPDPVKKKLNQSRSSVKLTSID